MSTTKKYRPIALAMTLGVCARALRQTWRPQDYPTRPIKIIVGFAPGGGVDTVARLVGQEMSKGLGQSVVIENRPGAAGTIGATAAARSEPDGYTLVMFPGGHPLYGATHKSLPFDTVTSFEWISTVVTLQFLALVRAEAKYQSMAELIAAAKAAPETITYASAGVGSTHHLTIEMIANRAERQIPARSLPGRCPGAGRAARRPGAIHARHPDPGDRQHPGRQGAGAARSPATPGCRRCPMRRPSSRPPASRTSTSAPGSASPRRRACRARS